MTGPLAQLRALLGLRWQMARAPGARLATLVGGVVLAWLLVQAVRAGRALDIALLATAIEVAPAAYAGFGLLAVLAPLTSGGGHLVPDDQLVAYPVRPVTHLLGGLLLAPLNLVWVSQLLLLAALTSCLTLGGSLLRGSVTTLAYVLAVTVLGQLAAWLLAGLSQSRGGRRLAGGTAAVAVGAVVVALQGRSAAGLLAGSPTADVVDGVIAGGDGHLTRWSVTTGLLLLFACVALGLGVVACRWALRRPGDLGGTLSGVRRRRSRPGALRSLVAVDRASVWRAPALRRAGLVLAVLPGLLAASAALPWSSLAVLPGLVAAGAALLFGVNAFALDAGGAVWLSSLPHDPLLGLWSKAVVLTETVLLAVVLAAVAGSTRSPGLPTAAELAALLCSAVLCTAVVVTLSLSASVRRPHRADLRGPRDAVAPPGALALASARLALPAGLVAVVLGTAGGTGVWWLPPAVTAAVLGLCAVSAARTVRSYTDTHVRARVVHIVAEG